MDENVDFRPGHIALASVFYRYIQQVAIMCLFNTPFKGFSYQNESAEGVKMSAEDGVFSELTLF